MNLAKTPMWSTGELWKMKEFTDFSLGKGWLGNQELSLYRTGNSELSVTGLVNRKPSDIFCWLKDLNVTLNIVQFWDNNFTYFAVSFTNTKIIEIISAQKHSCTHFCYSGGDSWRPAVASACPVFQCEGSLLLHPHLLGWDCHSVCSSTHAGPQGEASQDTVAYSLPISLKWRNAIS